MNIWRCELTDRRSAHVRFWLRLLWCAVGFAASLSLRLHDSGHTRLLLAFGVALLLYVPAFGFALDTWRLRHPAIPDWRVSLLAWVGALLVFPLMVLCIVLIH